MFNRTRAEARNAKALKLQDEGRIEEAIAFFHKAAAADPHWSTPEYNLGLLFKNQCRWEESLKANRRAAELDPENKAAWWNLGVAATALGRWNVARRAWREFGVKLPEGHGPIDLPCGFCPIRLHPKGDAEVVWAERIDPARAVLASIPFPESNFRWKDVVLNDGAPTGYRKYKGQDVPVFDALQLLERSPFGTYVVRAVAPPAPEHFSKLADIAAELDGSAEDWSTSTRLLCKACSEGRPHAQHDRAAEPPDGVHLLGIAAKSRAHGEEILAKWKAQTEGVQVEAIEEGLPAEGEIP
jgi:tetratricopeptide (TPR) repeat protein